MSHPTPHGDKAPCGPRHGFSLVELLVVIAIIGTLTGLLLPAVQTVREAGRKTVCRNNLKQITLATLNYESARKQFPAAVNSDPAELPCNSVVSAKRHNWVVNVLPFLEQNEIYNQFDLGKSPADAANAAARAVRIGILMCPSDQYNGQAFMGNSGSETTMWGDNWARGNYGANSSLRFLGNDCCEGLASGSSAEGWADNFRRGVMGFNTAVSAKNITDGLSSTALLLELRAGITSYDPRGVWAIGMPGASSLWAHGGIYHDANGPNAPFFAADDIPNCFQLRNAFGGSEGLAKKVMGCYPGGTTYWQGAASRSMHPNGVFVSCADGSVHWVNDFVDVMPSTADAPSVWDRLMLSADGHRVSHDAL